MGAGLRKRGPAHSARGAARWRRISAETSTMCGWLQGSSAEEGWEMAIGKVEEVQQRLVKEKADRARQERIERSMAGGGGGAG